MIIKKELLFVLVYNDIDFDKTFNAISESIITWESSEIKNKLKLSRAEIHYQNQKFTIKTFCFYFKGGYFNDMSL